MTWNEMSDSSFKAAHSPLEAFISLGLNKPTLAYLFKRSIPKPGELSHFGIQVCYLAALHTYKNSLPASRINKCK